MSTLFPFAEKVAAWILRHDRRHQEELAAIRKAAEHAEAIYLDEPAMHPERYPDREAFLAAQYAWQVRSAAADAAVQAMALPR